jgi:mannose-6-phosphate isomerase-like protein (cupin superfamily)
MRRLITGVDTDGRSCIVEESEVTPGAVPGIAKLTMANLWNLDQCPPPPGPAQTGHFGDVRLPPGHVRWMVVHHEPHDADGGATTASEMHHTNAVDLIVVLEGSTRMVLQADERDLEPGDCVVMAGVDHAFSAGPAGCTVMSVAIGAPNPPD